MGMFDNLKQRLFGTQPVAKSPGQSQSGLVSTVISRTDPATGKKKPIATTPLKFQPINVGEPVIRKSGDYWQGWAEK